MRKLSILVISLSVSLAACVTTSTNFTTQNVMNIRQGMTSEQVFKMFGEPQDIRVDVCGMPPNQWNCTTWEYEIFPEGDASFTFADVEGQLLLNNYDIDRESW